jgi:hypothetical protein
MESPIPDSSILEFLAKLDLDSLEQFVRNAIEKGKSELVKILLSDPRIKLSKFAGSASCNSTIWKILQDRATAKKQEIINKVVKEPHLLDYGSSNNQENYLFWNIKDDLFANKNECLVMTYPINGTYLRCPRPVADRDFFEKFLKRETNDILGKMNWDNIILAGDFLSKIMFSNGDKEWPNSDDIQLHIWGPTEDVVRTKYEYIYGFLKVHKPIYTMSESILHVIIPKLKRIIQIVPHIGKKLRDIINGFDFNYLEFWYDGTDVLATLRGLVAIKFDLISYNHATPKESDDTGARTATHSVTPISDELEARTATHSVTPISDELEARTATHSVTPISDEIEQKLVEFIRRGFRIEYNPILQSLTTIVKDKYIDFAGFEANEKKRPINDKSVILDCLDLIDEHKRIEFAKSAMTEFSLVSYDPISMEVIFPKEMKTTGSEEPSESTGSAGPRKIEEPTGEPNAQGIQGPIVAVPRHIEKMDLSDDIIVSSYPVPHVHNPGTQQFNLRLAIDGPSEIFCMVVDFGQAIFYFSDNYPIANVPIGFGTQDLLAKLASKISKKIGSNSIRTSGASSDYPEYSRDMFIEVHLRNKSAVSVIASGGKLPVILNLCKNNREYYFEYTY